MRRIADLHPAESTRLTNRLRDPLLPVHPTLKRLLGKHFNRPDGLELRAQAPTPAAPAQLDAEAMTEIMRPGSPRLAKTLPAKIHAALAAQTVATPGTEAFGTVIAGVAAQLRDTHTRRTALAADLEQRLAAHPPAEVLTSMPGIGFADRHHHHRRRLRVPYPPGT